MQIADETEGEPRKLPEIRRTNAAGEKGVAHGSHSASGSCLSCDGNVAVAESRPLFCLRTLRFTQSVNSRSETFMSILTASVGEEVLRDNLVPLQVQPGDYDPLLQMVGTAHYVLLGEASHGTDEFYRARCEVTRRLIEEKEFSAVAVEADWPDAYRLNRYVRGEGNDRSAREALDDFKRFPTWMWRNTAMLEFIEWLREHNLSLRPDLQTGFYGLDLFSLYASMAEVLDYLEQVDPAAAKAARHRYSCFDHLGADSETYGYRAGLGLTPSCEKAVLRQLMEMKEREADYSRLDGRAAADEFFFAEQNARLVRNAEAYYRSLFRGRPSSWNLRDAHMAETLRELVGHLRRVRSGPRPDVRVAVWAHNSHLGDARATEMGRHGELNLGQLVREKHEHDALLVGFTTHHGTVSAASEWGGAVERKRVRPALEGSYEALFHETGTPRFFLNLRDDRPLRESLLEERLERAIGVIYLPQSERVSHYFQTSLPRQFDAVLHFDETHALEPLETTPSWLGAEAPETYPTGL